MRCLSPLQPRASHHVPDHPLHLRPPLSPIRARHPQHEAPCLHARLRFLPAGHTVVPLYTFLTDVRALQPSRRGTKQPNVVGGFVRRAGVGLEQLDGETDQTWGKRATETASSEERCAATEAGGLIETAAIQGQRHVFDVANAGEGSFQFFHSGHDEGGFGQFFDQRQTEQGNAFVYDVGGRFEGKIAGTHQPEVVLDGGWRQGTHSKATVARGRLTVFSCPHRRGASPNPRRRVRGSDLARPHVPLALRTAWMPLHISRVVLAARQLQRPGGPLPF